ncbi:hypothetical protein [Undibacterium curvum]|uniref:hypothetical protein n=1 Tax=Undibacterium curvum TaxID=2762294 RepID=UPI003D0FF105
MWEILLNLIGIILAIYYIVTLLICYSIKENEPLWQIVIAPLTFPVMVIYEFRRRIAEVLLFYAAFALVLVVLFKLLVWVSKVFR